MKTSVVIGALLVSSAFIGLATADPRSYVQPNACPGGMLPNPPLQGCLSITDCDGVEASGVNVGGVRFCVGHVNPDANGQATITVSDNVVSPVAANYCQDLNANSICGEPDTANPGSGNFVEPRVFFCGSVTITTPIDLTPRTPAAWAGSGNWDTASIILIFLAAVGNGNAASNGGAGNACGTLYAGGTTGSVDHS